MNSEKLSTDAVNCLCGLDMRYTIIGDEFDEMLGKLKLMNAYTQSLENALRHNIQSANTVLRRFKLTDGAIEELDEIVRVSQLTLGEK